MSFSIRPAREADHGTCRHLLPTAFPLIGRPPELVVAEVSGEVVGVCATAWLPRWFPIALHVVAGARRRGIGRALIAAAAAAADGETSSLRPWSSVTQESDAEAFLTACGFVVAGRLQVYELEPTRLRESIGAIAARARARVPDGVRLVSPRDAPRDALLELVGNNLLTPRPYLEDALFGDGRGYDQELSRVVLVGDEVAGAILAHRRDDTMEVDLNVVDPAWRGGWVNLMQVDTILRNGQAAGLGRLRFLAAPHVKNTINLAERGGGSRLPDLLTLALPLNHWSKPFNSEEPARDGAERDERAASLRNQVLER